MYSVFTVVFCSHHQHNGARAALFIDHDSALSAGGLADLCLSISQFRENFNRQNPDLPLNEFRAIENSRDKANLTRAASKINENLYASTALERGTLKVKSMQITWLPIQGPEQKAAKAKALEYMAAIIRTVAPLLTKEQSQKKLQKMLIAGKGKHYYAETEGAVRYVVADNGEKGLTFAVEPIKLTLSENLEGAN